MRAPLASLLLFFPVLPAFVLGGWLELDRAAVARGEVWRLLTGHWTHWTLDHLLWDSLAFLVLAALCEIWISRRVLLATVAGSALAVSAGVWLALPEIDRYRGLSGIDSALFVLAAARVLRETRSPLGGLALAAFLAKAAWEVSTGSTLFTEAADSFIPVPLAHLIGGACGLAAAWQQSCSEKTA
jgi:rhomboid family GlyGly-CTERM serine protease